MKLILKKIGLSLVALSALVLFTIGAYALCRNGGRDGFLNLDPMVGRLLADSFVTLFVGTVVYVVASGIKSR
jgi:hypothetical protein